MSTKKPFSFRYIISIIAPLKLNTHNFTPAPGDIRIGAVEVEMGHPASNVNGNGNNAIGKKAYEMEEQVTGVPVDRPLDNQTPPGGAQQDLQSPDNVQ